MLSFLILKWEDDLLWKRFKNIELIYETWSREVWFFFPYSTHVNFFFSIFCSVKKIDLHLICFCFVFGSSFEANWKETHSTPYPNFSVRKILAYFYVTPKINWPLASESLWDLREWDKKLCVCQCVFFSSWFCTILAYNFKTETHFKHQYQKLTFSLRCTSLNSYIVFIFLRDFCSFKLRSQFLCTKMNKNWLSK